MSKSILVTDMPENCLKCEFSERRVDGTLRCTKNTDPSNSVFGLSKADWCPLKEMPNRKSKKNKYHNDYERGIVEGYNLCIDEILKEGD